MRTVAIGSSSKVGQHPGKRGDALVWEKHSALPPVVALATSVSMPGTRD